MSPKGWKVAFANFGLPEVRSMLMLGFFSGLPFPLVLTTLALRLKQAGIDKSTIGYFSWVGLAYSLKFFWSPVVDRVPLPMLSRLGRRRGWMLLAQAGVVLGLVLMALHDPASSAEQMAKLAVFTAFCAATQDIAVDAYRIESTEASLQAATTASYQIGYQLALIAAGAGALVLADNLGWLKAYLAMAGLMSLGIVTTLMVNEKAIVALKLRTASDHARIASATANLKPVWMLAATALLAAWCWYVPATGKVEPVVKPLLLGLVALLTAVRMVPVLRPAWEWLMVAVIFPITDFYARNGWQTATFLLLLIATYRLNYTTMGVMAGPFYLDKGYTLTEIASISKLYGVIMTMIGGILAGVMVASFGFARTLITGIVILAGANLLYAFLATFQPGIGWLTIAISIDNLGNGIAGTAFIAYMSSLINREYTATQYALFGTLWSLPAKTIAGFSGEIATAWGYRDFFIYTAVISAPALILLLVLWAKESREKRALEVTRG